MINMDNMDKGIMFNFSKVNKINDKLQMNRKRKYHKSNCDSTVRAIVTDALGRKVILVGKHAFEWSIILEKEGKLVITTFPNREKAVDTFNNKYRRK